MGIAIVLNEVHYDPAGADGGYEFVELAAASGAVGAEVTSLAGWRLETGNGASAEDWKLAWVGTAGDALEGGLFVVGESGVAPAPHVVTDLDLQNGPDACRLVSPEGAVDVLGWGTPLPSGMFEGQPAADAASGWSLARRPDGRDTNVNAADFVAAAPTPGAFNSAERSLAVMWVDWPPGELADGQGWTFRWHVRNDGRQGWSGFVRATCAVHPSETLVRGEVAPALAPGAEAVVEAWAWPPPGAHLPRSDPEVANNADAEPSAWLGAGVELSLSEILAAPAPGEPEWVEVFATSAVELEPFELRDAAGARAALTGQARAGAFVVLTPDSLAFRRRWGSRALVCQVSPWPTLNQTAPAGAVAERLSLVLGEREVAVGVVPGHGTNGVSWERIARSLPGDVVPSWGACLDPDGGTPGRANSRQGDRTVPGGEEALRVLPQPFLPGRGASALIVVNPAAPRTRYVIDIWDSTGRRVTTLATWSVGAEHRAVWDGRREDGSPAPLGLYVVRAVPEGAPALRAPLVVVR